MNHKDKNYTKLITILLYNFNKKNMHYMENFHYFLFRNRFLTLRHLYIFHIAHISRKT